MTAQRPSLGTAPDGVCEVLSPGTKAHDRDDKLPFDARRWIALRYATQQHTGMLAMTLGKHGYRPIVVEGHKLLWRVRPEGCPCGHPHAVVVADASRKGSVVLISGPPWTSAKGAIVPRQVADGARRALEVGWIPGEGSGVFVHLGEHAGP